MPFDQEKKATVKKPDVVGITTGEIDPAQEVETFLKEIGRYNEYGKVLRRDSLREVGQQLAKIAQMAEVAITTEADDWFDAHTLKRNMKEVNNYASDFMKLAEEADMINQRMSALYDDMGRVLDRYFEIPDIEDVEAGTADASDVSQKIGVDGSPLDQAIQAQDPQIVKEMEIQGRDSSIFNATPLPPVQPESEKKDELTLKAIIAVHKRLKVKNPQAASKFAKLPPEKMKEVVWELCQRV